MILLLVTALLQSSAFAADPIVNPGSETGNCYSGRLNFENSSRIFRLGGSTDRRLVYPDKYDFTIDNGDVKFDDSGATFTMHRPQNRTHPADNAKMSTARYVQYGRMTARFTPSNVPGVVTSFITMSDKAGVADGNDIHDEIDIEVVGKDVGAPQYNVFTFKTTHLEKGLHGGPLPVSIAPGVPHEYFIDWRSDMISWGVDGQVLKSITRAASRSLTNAIPDHSPWFPVSPSVISFSIWDGSEPSFQEWSGGPIDWSKHDKVESKFEWIDIQCYDSNNNPVQKWPADSPDPYYNKEDQYKKYFKVDPNSAPRDSSIITLTTISLVASVIIRLVTI